MPHAPSLVWLYKDRDSDELRYSVRSLTTNLRHSDVWIVGDRPDWYRGEWLAADTSGDFRRNTIRQMRLACLSPNITDPFIYANDDMFAFAPVEVPDAHMGTCAEVYTDRRKAGIRGGYVNGIKRSGEALEAIGISDPLCYELHIPMLIHKAPMLEALEMCERHLDDNGAGQGWLAKRTIYGNLAALGGTQMADVKVSKVSQPIPGGPWLSTNERTFMRHQGVIAEAFPVPSMWEA